MGHPLSGGVLATQACGPNASRELNALGDQCVASIDFDALCRNPTDAWHLPCVKFHQRRDPMEQVIDVLVLVIWFSLAAHSLWRGNTFKACVHAAIGVVVGLGIYEILPSFIVLAVLVAYCIAVMARKI